MKILMLYPKVPFPPNKGEKTRAFQQVKHLSRHHEVWVACFIGADDDPQDIVPLKEMCAAVRAVPLNKHLALSRGGLSLLRGETLTEGYYGSRAMWRVLHDWQQEHYFDVGLAFSSSMAAYLEELPVGRRVLDMCDCDSHKWEDYATKSSWPKSLMFRSEANRLAARERNLVRKFDLTTVVNGRELRRIGEGALRDKLAVFPTPVELSNYQSIWDIPRDQIIGFAGTMDYRPNIEAVLWFAEHVWPVIAERHAEARWWIVGRRPTRQVRKLAGDPRITVTGEVDDMLPYWARMRVFVAPTQTDMGVQSKVLEAMAAGRATVITPQGHQGIHAADRRDYVVADQPQHFAHAVGGLLEDHQTCVEMGKCAIDFIRRCVDASAVMTEFEQLLLGHEKQLHKVAS